MNADRYTDNFINIQENWKEFYCNIMNDQSYSGLQWVQQNTLEDLKTAGQLLMSAEEAARAEEIMADCCDSSGENFLVDDSADDQIAAQNLIFMAQDGQVSDMINSVGTDGHGAIIVAASDSAALMQHMNALAQQEEDVSGDYTEDYAETPQMVTEEVITDDWVQHQGEERVEIPAEQIIGSNSQVLSDIEVPLPTVQDEYTALRPYPCDFCSRRFRKKISLMNHMVAHQNDRPHLCKLCGSRFFRRTDLINHFRAHVEAADNEYEVSDFINSEGMDFVEPESQDEHNGNQYYDTDWNIDADDIPITHKIQRRNHMINDVHSENSTANTTQGRSTRTKIKEENYTINESIRNDGLDAKSSHLGYTHSHQQYHNTDLINSSQRQYDEPKRVFPVLDDSKPFVCQQCGLPFAREKALMAHQKSHRVDSPYECNQCNEMFWDTASLQDHQKSHQFEDSNSEYEPEGEAEEEVQSDSESDRMYGEFYCNVCGVSFHRQDLLRRHMRTHPKQGDSVTDGDNSANKDSHCCSTCGETFASALDLLAHAGVHARFPPFKCVLCGESFFEEQTIKRHLQCQHGNELTANSCILCGKECRDRKALIKHAWDHSREKCHSCSKCGKNFHNKARLKRHMVSHRNKSVACEVCGQEFPDGRSLSNHRHSHSTNTGGKMFPCHECGKTFGSRSSQQIHVRIHTGERPYGCRFCWKAFADGGTLRKHERIHTGEKPYACSVCPRAFNQRVVLREHIRSHHSGLDAKRGTYYCTVCTANLTSSNELMQHLIEHSDMNTARQRQPITGPRKYKRRRKLKPHELARLRNKNQNETNSDIDMSDFDIDNVDDLLGITDAASSSNIKDDPPLDVTEEKSGVKLRKRSKLIENKLNNSTDDNYKNLLSNLENTLQTIETLVVDDKKKSSESSSQRTKEVQLSKSDGKSTGRGRKRIDKNLKNTRPRMIHTEKSNGSESTDGSKRRSKTQVTRSSSAKLDLMSKNSRMVDDYEIISPDVQVPKQISSSPMHIKQEEDQPRSDIPSSLSARCSDLYDAQLLLEASTLRRETYEKYNPSIVNDLEEILRSPDKSQRHRFTSESSTQFLVDQSEEEHNMIKIEPTSPDLRDLLSGGSAPDDNITSAERRSSLRSTRSRTATMNRKYLEYETDLTVSSHIGSAPKRSSWNMQRSSMTKARKKISTSITSSSPYIDYDDDSPSARAANANASYSSISAVVHAADAVALSASVAASTTERRQRYFECEMCSAVFTDRAQLLDHVPIHI